MVNLKKFMMDSQVKRAFKHYHQRLKERFDMDISFDEYVEKRVLKRTLKEKYIGKTVLYLFNDKQVHVYFIKKKIEFPITVYQLDRFNKGKILKKYYD